MFNYFLLQYYKECGCFWTKTFNISYMTKCIRQLAEWVGIFGSYILILILFPKTFPTVMSKCIRLVHHWTSVLIFLYTVLFSLHIIHSVNRTNIKCICVCVCSGHYIKLNMFIRPILIIYVYNIGLTFPLQTVYRYNVSHVSLYACTHVLPRPWIKETSHVSLVRVHQIKYEYVCGAVNIWWNKNTNLISNLNKCQK